MGLFKTLVWTLITAFVALLAVYVAKYYSKDNGDSELELEKRNSVLLGEEGAFLFKSLDVNDDGQLSPEELAPVIEKLVGKASLREVVDTGEKITLEAFFTPLVLETLRATKDIGAPSFLDDEKVSKDLRNWTKPATKQQTFNTRDFAVFLPNFNDVDVGRAWRIYSPEDKEYKNSRYFPPLPHDRAALLSRLLKMFHPRTFLETRFMPRGSVALIKAYDDQYLDIAFRIHAEFQLNEPPSWPFWYTPAQFTGNLVISRDGGNIRDFHLYVPAKRALNVDMEWLTKDNELDMEVEIGYMPRMELETVSISGNDDDKMDTKESNSGVITWTKEIPWEEAEVELEKVMYPFKQVKYHSFSDVFDRAKSEQKLIHNIVLWGALDDQSC